MTDTTETTAVLRMLNEVPRPGEHVYLVGGCVRDLLLGRQIKDFDLVTDMNPRPTAERIPRRVGGRPFTMHSERRVVPPRSGGGVSFDMQPTAGTIEEDLLARDFTINAMALGLPLDPEHPTQHLLDPAGGAADIGAGVLRHVQPGIFVADPVRLMRAVRIAGKLGFALAPETEALVREHASLLAGAAVERSREEVFLVLEVPGRVEWLRRMDALGLFSVLFPELEPLKGLEQNENHHLDVWEHTLEVVRRCEEILAGAHLPADLSAQVGEALAQPACPPRSRAALLFLSALLHDVAKPQTRAVNERGITTFWDHDEAGAEVAALVCQRYRLSNRETKAVTAAVRTHLRPGFLCADDPPSRRDQYHFFRDTGDAAIEALVLSLADRLAARGPWATEAQVERHSRFVAEMLRLTLERAPVAHPVVPVDGRTLMRALRIPGGPRLGEVVVALQEEVAAGTVSNRDEALAFAREWVQSHPAPAA